MEKPPLYSIRHSLQEMTLRSIIVNIWNLDDILLRIEEFDLTRIGYDLMFGWQETIEIKVKEKISNLLLPNPLKRRLNLLVRPVGIQIIEWMHFVKDHLGELRQSFSVLKQLDWAATGAINYECTATKLVCLSRLDVVKRFKLACTYCLDDLLPLVWWELPKEYKDRFCDSLLENAADSENIIELYWAYVIKREEAKLVEKLPSLFLNAFHFSACSGNKVATQYFFRKLTVTDIENILFITFNQLLLDESTNYMSPWDFPEEKYSDVLCFLLTVLPPEDQVTVVRNFPSYVFRIFLHWPWQDHLAANADLIWKFLFEESKYENMLRHIRKKMLHSGYYSPKVIQESFRHSPPEFRKLFVDKECLGERLFPLFLNLDDTETFRFILRSMDYEDRVRLITCDTVVHHFDNLILMASTHVVELCIREATASKEDRNRLKEIFLGSLNDRDLQFSFKKHEWQRVFDSIDESEESFLRKRKLVYEEPAEAKKPCT